MARYMPRATDPATDPTKQEAQSSSGDSTSGDQSTQNDGNQGQQKASGGSAGSGVRSSDSSSSTTATPTSPGSTSNPSSPGAAGSHPSAIALATVSLDGHNATFTVAEASSFTALDGSPTSFVIAPSSNSSSAGPIAGGVVGGLAVGALLALLLSFLVLRRKFSRRLASQEQRFDRERAELMADSHSDKGVPQTLLYTDPAQEKQLKDAQARIKTLEAERNAASAFGDKLDGKAEQELLTAPSFGLSVLNEKINQLAMSVAVSASGKGSLGTGPLTANKAESIAVLTSRGPKFAHDHFEGAVRHIVNSTLYERVCTPFCFEAAEQGRSNGFLKIAKEVLRENDQAMYARWRSMTHATLRTSSEKRAAQTNTTAVATVQQYLFNALVETLLYAGMEPDLKAAGQTATAVHARLGEVTAQLAKLMTVVREEMSTNDYSVDVVPFNSGAPTKALGLSAKAKGDASSRILLDSARV